MKCVLLESATQKSLKLISQRYNTIKLKMVKSEKVEMQTLNL